MDTQGPPNPLPTDTDIHSSYAAPTRPGPPMKHTPISTYSPAHPKPRPKVSVFHILVALVVAVLLIGGFHFYATRGAAANAKASAFNQAMADSDAEGIKAAAKEITGADETSPDTTKLEEYLLVSADASVVAATLQATEPELYEVTTLGSKKYFNYRLEVENVEFFYQIETAKGFFGWDLSGFEFSDKEIP